MRRYIFNSGISVPVQHFNSDFHEDFVDSAQQKLVVTELMKLKKNGSVEIPDG
jgi:hypothetical protein